MKIRYYLRGLGLGILVTTIFFLIGGSSGKTMSDEQIKERAKELGMIESTVLAEISTEEVPESAQEAVVMEESTIETVEESKTEEGEETSEAFIEESTEAAAILCDNAYRRIKDETCSAHLKINIDAAGNLTRISRAQLDSGVFAPKNVQAGEFNILAQLKQAGTIKKAKKIIDVSAFEGKYNFHTRAFSALEKSLIPKLPEWYIVPQVVMDICNHAQKTTGRPTQMRNFLLRGEAGTGKTMGAKAIAAGLGLPYMKYLWK